MKFNTLRTILIFVLFITYIQADQPITLFCHGIVGNQRQSRLFQELLEQPVQLFNFQDAQKPEEWDLNSLIFQSCSLFGKFVNRNKMFMGHGQDIATLAEQIDPTKEYIIYGVSRGGSAAINYIADYNPANIKALVLDATPADMISPIDMLQYEVGYKFAPNRITQEAIFQTLFPAYQVGAVPPVDNIVNIVNKNLPIFIVHSMEDTRVSIVSAWQLYVVFKRHGFTNVYLCQLEHGKHAFYMQGADKDLYAKALHSFYKHYGFAYDRKYADMDLALLQPPLEEIEAKIELFQKNLENIYDARKSQLQNSMLVSAVVIPWWLYYYSKESKA